MTKDVKCPYCEKWQEINHDDGYGYEEDRVYEQECEDCEKTFIYTTSISFYYEAEKAPCKNGEDHDWQKISGYPREVFENKRRCSYCDEETKVGNES